MEGGRVPETRASFAQVPWESPVIGRVNVRRRGPRWIANAMISHASTRLIGVDMEGESVSVIPAEGLDITIGHVGLGRDRIREGCISFSWRT